MSTIRSRHPHFTPPSEAVENRVGEMLARLSLEEKIDLLGGNTKYGATKGNESAGIPELKMADGPLGVHWWCDYSTAYPASIMLAATWDRDLAYRAGEAVGRDARARGVHILLAPGVNLYRSPLCGRNFEYLGEEPYLSARMVTQYVRGCQDQGVATTVKHYAVNYQEYDRHRVSSDVDPRTLHEAYLQAFRAAVQEGGTGCIMTAYNLVNGEHCSQHEELLCRVLKEKWGFDGLVMSDWVSTYDAVGAANGGLDLEMPTAIQLTAEKLLPAVRNGLVSEATIDDKVRRLLRLAVCFGWLDHEQKDETIPLKDEKTADVALEVARRGAVLLKNDGVLPLDAAKLKRVAVVGPTAHPAVLSGGGSAYCPPWRQTSVLEGLQKALPGVAVVHAPGASPWRDDEVAGKSVYSTPNGAPGLLAEYFNNDAWKGEPSLTQVEERPVHGWYGGPIAEGVTKDHFSIRWTGSFRPEKSGEHILYARPHDGECRITAAGQVVIDTLGQDVYSPQQGRVTLEAGRECPVVLEYRNTRGWNAFLFGWEHREVIDHANREAVDTARGADAVVFCGGFNPRSEGEGWDRSFAMHPEVEGLLGRVAEANANTVVVLTGGGNMDMEGWIGQVRGVLHSWYPGQEGGTAVAEILTGAVNPSGRLPATFEMRVEDRSSHGGGIGNGNGNGNGIDSYHDADSDKRVRIADGVFFGYRHHDRTGVAPRFAFGYGLSYTTFEYENLTLSAKSVARGGKIVARFEVTNTGTRAGAEVAQLYVADPVATLPRPAKELRGFSRVELAPGERRTVEIEIAEQDLAYYDPDRRDWVAEPGDFEVLVGASAPDIRLRAGFRLE